MGRRGGEVEKERFRLSMRVPDECDTFGTIKIVGPRALSVGTEALDEDELIFCVQRRVVDGIVAHSERVPIMASNLRVLPHEMIKTLRVWVPRRPKVAKTPLPNQPGRVTRLLQHTSDGVIRREERGVRAIVAANRSVAEMPPLHEHRTRWCADLAAVSARELHTVLREARYVRRWDSRGVCGDLVRDGVIAVPKIIG